jgi:hypothetical protein
MSVMKFGSSNPPESHHWILQFTRAVTSSI